MSGKEVFVGMDFGSFKTSVVASNGRRETFHTSVGWPKDHVARAMLGRDVVFGQDIVRQRLALEVVRPFERGTLKYLKSADAGVSDVDASKRREAARLLVQHALSSLGLPHGSTVYGVVGAPSRANAESKAVIMEAIQGHFDAAVIVAEPFTVAYSMNRLTETLVVDIGAGTIDICPIYGSYPTEEDQVTLPMGGDTIDECFLEALKAAHPEVQVSLNMAREIKEKHGFVHDVNEIALVTLPVHGVPTQVDVTEPLKHACKTIAGPIIQGIREVVARFDPEFQRPMLNHVLLGGGGSQLKGLDTMIEEGLRPLGGGNVTKVYDSVFAGAVGALKLAMNMPSAHWQRLAEFEPGSPAEASSNRRAA